MSAAIVISLSVSPLSWIFRIFHNYGSQSLIGIPSAVSLRTNQSVILYWYRTTMVGLLYFAIAILCIGFAAGADPTQAIIQAEGMACFAMATSIPGLKTMAGEQSLAKVDYVSSSYLLCLPCTLLIQNGSCRLIILLNTLVSTSKWRCVCVCIVLQVTGLSPGKTVWTSTASTWSCTRNLEENIVTDMMDMDALTAHVAEITLSVHHSLFTTQPPRCLFQGVTCGTVLGSPFYASVT